MNQTSFRQKIALVIFGIVLLGILLEIGLRIGGFVFLAVQEHRNMVSMRKAEAYKIICLGESTTAIGGKDSYPSQLEELLNAQDTGITFSVINTAVAGTRTPIIIDNLPGYLERYQPDMVVSMMGINDHDDLFIDINNQNGRKFLDSVRPPFYKSLRVYKLISLLNKHIRSRIGGNSSDRLASNNQIPGGIDQEGDNVEDQMPEDELSDPRRYYKIGSFFREKGEYVKAATMYEKFLTLSPEDYYSHLEIGWYYKDRGEYKEAERVFKAASRIDPSKPDAYIGLGWTYGHWYDRPGYLEMAEDMFNQAIKYNPKNAYPYIEAAVFFREPCRHDLTEKLIKKAIRLEPDNIRLYTILGDAYMALEKDDLAQEMLSKVRSFSPKTAEDYYWLIESYVERHDFSDAEAVFKEAVNSDMADDRLYRIMRICFEMQKKYDLAAKYFHKEKESSLENYSAMTYHSYQRLKEITAEKGIELICVQYPLRSIDILKALVGNTEEVVFVDNQQVFEDALAEGAYPEYFTDIFGGDFGHCTKKGNRLLAGNVARAIINNLGFAYERQRDTD